jgi:hypothetical protein
MEVDGVLHWFLGLGKRYGVNPIVFGAIYVGAIPFFWLSVGWLFRRLRRGHSIVAPSLSAGFFFVSAYLYLILAGRNVPAWVYVVVVLLVTGSAWSTVKSLRARSRAARTEMEAHGSASTDPVE